MRLRVIDLGIESGLRADLHPARRLQRPRCSESDKAIVAWFVEHYGDDLLRLLPPEIPQKETLALLAGCLLKRSEPTYLLPHLKTATDVLRVAVVMSGGDVSLATPTKFRKFSRRERRFLLASPGGCGEITEDMLRWQGYWVRLGEILHPFEYKDRYPKVYEAFDVLRNDRPFATFNSKVEAGLTGGDLGPVIGLLRQRPGVFARRLDHLLRLGGGPDAVESFLRSPIGSPRRSSSRSTTTSRAVPSRGRCGLLPEGQRRQGPGPGGVAAPAAARPDGCGSRRRARSPRRSLP